MKTLKISAIALFTAAGMVVITGCSNEGEEKLRKNVSDFEAWVDRTESDLRTSVNEDWDEETWEREWTDVEREYDEWTTKIEDTDVELNDELETKYEQSRAKYESMKRDYGDRYGVNEGPEDNLYSDFSGGLRREMANNNPDFNLESAEARDLRGTYDRFYNYIDRNAATMTAADWEEAERTWNRLETRRQAVEGNLSQADRAELDSMRTRYNNLRTSGQNNMNNRDNTMQDNNLNQNNGNTGDNTLQDNNNTRNQNNTGTQNNRNNSGTR